MVLTAIQYNDLLKELITGIDKGYKLAEKYRVSTAYVAQLNHKLRQLKNPPRIENEELICYECGHKKDSKLVFHHIHSTGEIISLLCYSCNKQLEQSESGCIEDLQDVRRRTVWIPKEYLRNKPEEMSNSEWIRKVASGGLEKYKKNNGFAEGLLNKLIKIFVEQNITSEKITFTKKEFEFIKKKVEDLEKDVE